MEPKKKLTDLAANEKEAELDVITVDVEITPDLETAMTSSQVTSEEKVNDEDQKEVFNILDDLQNALEQSRSVTPNDVSKSRF